MVLSSLLNRRFSCTNKECGIQVPSSREGAECKIKKCFCVGLYSLPWRCPIYPTKMVIFMPVTEIFRECSCILINKNAKLGQFPAILNSHSVNNPYILCMHHSTPAKVLCLSCFSWKYGRGFLLCDEYIKNNCCFKSEVGYDF